MDAQRAWVGMLLLQALVGSAIAQSGSLQRNEAYDPPNAARLRASLTIQSQGRQDTLHVTVGQSIILRSAAPMRRIYVGDPAVLQTLTSAANEVVITAKQAGVSSLVVWDQLGDSCLYAVVADLDVGGLRAALDSALPGNHIDVSASRGMIRLTGAAPTAESAEAAAKLAGMYTKEVVNSLRVELPRRRQVELKLKIVEVDRTKLDQFGVNIFGGKSNQGSVSTQQFNVASSVTSGGGATSVNVSDPLNLFLYASSLNLGMTLKDLENKQVLQILSEPTLIAMSGESARFLSGGEFPFPVVQGGTSLNTAITIQFRPYGVKVEFTPQVNPDGSIQLKVSPEVSTLDYSNAVTISGFTIPAVATRRAETQVELRDGQTFAISGLLDHRTSDALSKMPGIASIPILGELFRSKSVQRSTTELVVLATVRIVDPLAEAAPAVEPQWSEPNLDVQKFDRKMQQDAPRVPGQKPAAGGQ